MVKEYYSSAGLDNTKSSNNASKYDGDNTIINDDN